MSKVGTFQARLTKCLSFCETDQLFDVYTSAYLCEQNLLALPKFIKKELTWPPEDLRKYSEQVGSYKLKLNTMQEYSWWVWFHLLRSLN